MNHLYSFCNEAAQGNLAAVKKLVTSNPDLISSKQDDDNTPLHLAAENGHKDVVEVLLANGAPVTDRAHLATDYMCVATEKGHKAVVEVLLPKTLAVLADTNENIRNRRSAASALGTCGDVRAVETLCKVFEGADEDLLMDAAYALSELGDPVDLPHKIFFCEEMSIPSRIAALNALHALGQYRKKSYFSNGSYFYKDSRYKYKTPDALSYCKKWFLKLILNPVKPPQRCFASLHTCDPVRAIRRTCSFRFQANPIA